MGSHKQNGVVYVTHPTIFSLNWPALCPLRYPFLGGRADLHRCIVSGPAEKCGNRKIPTVVFLFSCCVTD